MATRVRYWIKVLSNVIGSPLEENVDEVEQRGFRAVESVGGVGGECAAQNTVNNNKIDTHRI